MLLVRLDVRTDQCWLGWGLIDRVAGVASKAHNLSGEKRLFQKMCIVPQLLEE